MFNVPNKNFTVGIPSTTAKLSSCNLMNYHPSAVMWIMACTCFKSPQLWYSEVWLELSSVNSVMVLYYSRFLNTPEHKPVTLTPYAHNTIMNMASLQTNWQPAAGDNKHTFLHFNPIAISEISWRVKKSKNTGWITGSTNVAAQSSTVATIQVTFSFTNGPSYGFHFGW